MTRSSAGTFVVLAGSRATVAVAGRFATTHRDAIQRAIEGDEPAVTFLDELTAGGVRELPDFAFVGREGTAARVLLRGPIAANARLADGSTIDLVAGSVSTWTETVQEGCLDITLSDGRGRSLAVVTLALPPAAPPLVQLEPASAPEQDEVTATGGSLETTLAESEDAVPESVATDETMAPRRPLVAEPEEDSELFESFTTQHVKVEDVAVVVEAPPPPSSILPTLPPPAGAPVNLPPPPMITGVPGAPSVDEVVVHADRLDELHDGLTISGEQLKALREEAALPGATGASAVPSGPQLQAVSCPSGHLNPPQASDCRACGASIVDRAVRVVARPTLGHLAFDSGMVADLDRPLLIGRKPTADGHTGTEVPGVVVLPDSDGSLSRIHIELRLEGWEVLVVDRNSTNGTRVEVPGQDPVVLHAGEPFLLSPGTRVVLADVASCTYRLGPR